MMKSPDYNRRLIFPRIMSDREVEELKRKVNQHHNSHPIEIEHLILDREESIMLMKQILVNVPPSNHVFALIEDYLEKRNHGTASIEKA